MNTGSIDIKDDMVEENLKLSLPTNFKWLSVKIVDSTKGSKASTTIASENELVFNLGLFRKNEFLRFEALADVPQSADKKVSATTTLNEGFKFEHRIADTSKVEIRPMDLELPNLKKRMLPKISIPIVLLVYIVVLIFTIGRDDVLSEFHYCLKEGDSITILKAIPHINNTVELKRIDGSEYKTIPLKEFNASFQRTEIRKWESNSWGGNIFGGNIFWVMIIFMGIVFVLSITTSFINPFIEYRKIKKLRKTLNLNG